MYLPKEKISLGYSCEFEDICFLYFFLIGDIIKVGYDNFLQYYGLLTTTQEQIQDKFVKNNIDGEIPTPLQYLFMLFQLPGYNKIVEKAFEFFLHDTVLFLLNSYEIVVGDIREKHLLSEDNFENFQNCIRELVGDEPIEKIEENIDPRLARMRAKQRLRDQIKNKQAQEKIKYTFSTLMLSTCCLGVGVTFENIERLPYATMLKFHKLCADKDKYETDIASMIAGADSKQINLEYWVKD